MCAASIIRALPETEIPPVLRGDIYLFEGESVTVGNNAVGHVFQAQLQSRLVVDDLTAVDYNGPVFVTYDTLPGTFMLIGAIEFVA